MKSVHQWNASRVLGWAGALATSFVMLIAFSNCGGQSTTSAPPTSNTGSGAGAGPAGSNSMAVQIGSSCGYVNEPCVTVTLCMPGTSTCQTVNNVLLDTGSYGLRLFSSVVTLSLNGEKSGSNSIAECVTYGGGNSQWGPVVLADIQLGSETAPSVPMQLINSAYPGVPSGCTNLDTSPSEAGFDGILGVGLFSDDCGPGCATVASNNIYYTCTGSTCSSNTVAESLQVTNPVAMLPVSNNGIMLQLPSIPNAGSPSVNGTVYFGIATQSDNTPSGAVKYGADGNGNFQTSFQGTNYTTAFIDSGSNGLFFPAISSLPACSSSGNAPGFFCPTSDVSLSASIMGSSGSPSISVPFTITNANTAFDPSSPNMAFNDVGGDSGSGGNLAGDFDWGLPFFFGRSVYVGIDGKSSSLGAGPYWAF